MPFKAIVGIVLGAMLANNYALEKFLGAAPLLGWSAQEKKITALGVSVTVAMVLTALIAGLVQTYVLDALSLGYLQTLVFAANRPHRPRPEPHSRWSPGRPSPRRRRRA